MPQQVRVFVSSPGDAQFERMRVDRVVERLNGEFAGVARLDTIRWEREFYKAHATFQDQIPEAADCDIVIAILRHRLGTELPDDFPPMPNGSRYPSGTAYEVLTAIEAQRKRELPDVYVFRYPEPPTVRLDDDQTNALVTGQWEKLKVFFNTWFRTPEGHFKAAFQEFHSTDEFEAQVESLLRKWLEDRILKGRSVIWPIETKGTPFRGLAAYGVKHAPVFFGRSRDIAKATDVLKDAAERGAPFLLLVGASGAGKSSLAHAGLVPRLITPGVVPAVDVWRVAAMRPSEHADGPLAALAARLFEDGTGIGEDEKGRPAALPEIMESDYGTPTELADLLSHADDTSTKPILRALGKVAEVEREIGGFDRPVRTDLLLVVDQLDELFAGDVAEDQRKAFARVLSILAATGCVWIVATLRADLYERFLRQPELLGLKTRGATYDLAPPGAAEIAEIVRGPAKAANLIYEADPETGERLDERLLRDADQADMLPLLQFTLNRLFEQRHTADGETRLTLAAYDALGGLSGAIDKEAERAMSALGEAERERLPRLLRQLAAPTQHHAGAVDAVALTIRSVAFEAVAHDAPAERLVRALIEARILLSSSGKDVATIRLAHQRVLESWKRATEIVDANVDFYRIRQEVEDQLRRWLASGRNRDFLIPSGLPLAEAEDIGGRYADELSVETRGFIASSGKRARLRQRLTRAAAVLFAVLAVGASAAGILAFQAEQRAERYFAAAKQTVDGLIFDIAQGLRDVEGIRVESIAKVLNRVRDTVDRLSASASDDAELLRTRAVMLGQFASTYINVGDLGKALSSAEESLAISRRLAETDPGNTGWQRDVSVSLERIGDVRRRTGDVAGAEEAYEESLAISRRLASTDPGNSGWQRDVAVGLERISDVRLRLGNTAGALEAYEESLAVSRRLAETDPGNSEWQRDVAVSLNNIGGVRLRAGNTAGALEACEESLAISRRLAEIDPGNTQWQRDVAVSLDNIGDIRLHADDETGAMQAYEKSLAISRRLAETDPGNIDWQRDVAAGLDKIGDARLRAGDAAGAEEAYAESLAISRRLAEADPGNIE